MIAAQSPRQVLIRDPHQVCGNTSLGCLTALVQARARALQHRCALMAPRARRGPPARSILGTRVHREGAECGSVPVPKPQHQSPVEMRKSVTNRLASSPECVKSKVAQQWR